MANAAELIREGIADATAREGTHTFTARDLAEKLGLPGQAVGGVLKKLVRNGVIRIFGSCPDKNKKNRVIVYHVLKPKIARAKKVSTATKTKGDIAYTETSEKIGPTLLVRNWIKAHVELYPGAAFGPQLIAEKTGLAMPQVSAVLSNMRKRGEIVVASGSRARKNLRYDIPRVTSHKSTVDNSRAALRAELISHALLLLEKAKEL